MSQDDYSFIGGRVVSYKQQYKINQDLKAFEMSLQHKKRKIKSSKNSRSNKDQNQ